MKRYRFNGDPEGAGLVVTVVVMNVDVSFVDRDEVVDRLKDVSGVTRMSAAMEKAWMMLMIMI